MEFGQIFISSFRTVLMFPFVLGGNSFRLTFDCLCERYLTMIPCMLYAGDFRLIELLRELTVHMQAPSYWVNWLFTLLIIVHESSRFSSCSTEHLRIVSPQPRTPTRRRQSIDVYTYDSTCCNRRHRRESTKGVHGLVVRIAPVNYSTPAIVSALDSDWSFFYLLISH